MNKNIKITLFLFISLFLILLFSCTSTEFSVKDSNNNIYSAEKLLIEGDKAYNNNNYEIALKYYEAVLKYYPDDVTNSAWATYQIGYVYYKMEKYEEAKKYFNIVIEKYSNVKDCVSLSNMMLSRIEVLMKEDSSKDNNSN